MGNKTLIFNVTRKWYDMYASGVKREEYRDDTDYWYSRLYTINALPKRFDFVEIRCGYPPKGGRPETPNLRFKWVSTKLGFAKECIGKELMGDKFVRVIKMEDLKDT